MSIIQDFTVHFANADEKRRREIEGIMQCIILSDTETDLPPEIEAEIERRMADPNPNYVSAEEVFAEFGRRLPSA